MCVSVCEFVRAPVCVYVCVCVCVCACMYACMCLCVCECVLYVLRVRVVHSTKHLIQDYKSKPSLEIRVHHERLETILVVRPCSCKTQAMSWQIHSSNEPISLDSGKVDT